MPRVTQNVGPALSSPRFAFISQALGGALVMVLCGFGSGQAFAKGVEVSHGASMGLEYDSNVYRTFASTRSDALIRALFKHKGVWQVPQKGSLAWTYQLGGKKYFSESSQDILIQTLDIPGTLALSDSVQLSLSQELKFQLEDSTAPASRGDINKDFFSSVT